MCFTRLLNDTSTTRKNPPRIIEEGFSASLVGTIGFEPMTPCL
jgi:hypothetical protein